MSTRTRIRRRLVRLPVLRHLYQCAKCQAWTESPVCPVCPS
ncbi:hypothetical protein [Streptomyces sp. NPDC091649]